ncbi:MAG: hypothetical protein EA391_12925 [Balneolaceae bacterium]|nr:MAG: hypothetical protein EA391_12925 [Balneolaceae bacterium]
MSPFNLQISRFLLICYMAAWLAPLLPLLEYGLNWEQIATEECEMRDVEENGCNGFCYVTNRVVDLTAMHDEELPEEATLFYQTLLNHLAYYTELPCPYQKSIQEIHSCSIDDQYLSIFIDVLVPPPKG